MTLYNNVSGFIINTRNGGLIPISGSPFGAGSGPQGATVDATGKFVYVANHLSNNVSAYALNTQTGALTSMPGSPFAGLSPLSIANITGQNSQ